MWETTSTTVYRAFVLIDNKPTYVIQGDVVAVTVDDEDNKTVISLVNGSVVKTDTPADEVIKRVTAPPPAS